MNIHHLHHLGMYGHSPALSVMKKALQLLKIRKIIQQPPILISTGVFSPKNKRCDFCLFLLMGLEHKLTMREMVCTFQST